MKPSILLLVLFAAAFTSCTTAYKTGQTPDDVYFSPARGQDEYVQVDKKEDRYVQGSEDYYTDRYIRMRMQDRYRWSVLDDYYFNNAYAYNYYGAYNSWTSPWNNYWVWNGYCNPYYNPVVIIKNPVAFTPPSRAVAFNPKSYINNIPAPQQGSNTKSIGSSYYYRPGNTSSGGSYRYNNSNSYSNSNSSGSKTYSNSSSNSSSTPSSSTPTRSYSPSSSGSSSSSSSSGSSSSGGGSRPPR